MAYDPNTESMNTYVFGASHNSEKSEQSMKVNKYRRSYKACLNCRVRKVKCDLGPVDNPREGKCARCMRERKDCIFVESKRGGKHYSLRDQMHQNLGYMKAAESPQATKSGSENIAGASVDQELVVAEESAGNNAGHNERPYDAAEGNRNNISNMENTLVYLAKTAGSIARGDERDKIDAKERHDQIEATFNNHLSPSMDSSTGSSSSEKNSRNSSAIFYEAQNRKRSSPIPDLIKPSDPRKRIFNPIALNGRLVRPIGTNSLRDIDYIGGPDGILEEHEAMRLIDLFFTYMHPFFPYIPKFLRQSSVLPGYPILLCAILTIASRYFPFEDNITPSGTQRNIQVHDRLWVYVQRLISQTVWAEASTRSIGTVYAFLLFTEWNPRAIHWRWSDYANKEEEPDTNRDTANIDPPSSQQQDDENLAGLGAMRRGNRMAWMLIGSAVRLAQDMAFMDVSANTFLATHIAEINSVMNNGKRSMLMQSLSEIEIDSGDDDIEDSEQDTYEEKVLNMNEADLSRIALSDSIKFTAKQKAKIELMQLMCLSIDSLYGYKAQLGNLSQRQKLSILNLLNSLLNNWANKYKSLLSRPHTKGFKHSNGHYHPFKRDSKMSAELLDCVEQESLILEFSYTKLYIFSLALNPSPLYKTNILANDKRELMILGLKLDEISKSAKYIEIAFNAANDLLSSSHRLFKLRLLKFMPVRWVSRIVGAAAFIVKCYSTIKAHTESNDMASKVNSIDGFDSTILSLSLISVDQIVESIHRTAISLRDSSPDELHLCTRYSNVLMYLCSEMKNKIKNYHTANHNQKKRGAKHGMKLAEHEQEVNQEQTSLSPEEPMESSQLSDLNVSKHTGMESMYPRRKEIPRVKVNAQGAKMSDENIENLSNNERAESTPGFEDISQGLWDNEVVAWFANDKNVGLDFVGPWTELIEQQINYSDVDFTR